MSLKVITFDERYAKDFEDLNRAWIEKYFIMEPMDIDQLQKANDLILSKGGEIFFILVDDIAIATCAMVPHGHKSYELAKMAVDPKYQGKGFGDLLMQTSLTWAKLKKANEIILLSNQKLEAAITLYKKFGFKITSLEPHPDYVRCNIQMSLDLSKKKT